MSYDIKRFYSYLDFENWVRETHSKIKTFSIENGSFYVLIENNKTLNEVSNYISIKERKE